MKQVEVLLEHGVDCEKRDQDGWTALLVQQTDRQTDSILDSSSHLRPLAYPAPYCISWVLHPSSCCAR